MMFYRMMRRNPLQLCGDRSAALDLARGRLVLMGGFFVILYCLLAIRTLDLGFIQARTADDSHTGPAITASLPIEASRRGQILDRNGEIIATSLTMASLYADPKLISDPKNAAQKLSEIFPALSYGKALQKLQSKKRFVWMKRDIDPAQQDAVLELGEPGLAFRYNQKRVYPLKNSMSHLAGYTNIDGQGLSGLELSFNPMLAKGEDITLSIDIRLQHTLRREIEKAMIDFDAKGGVGVILNAKTGEVLAGVSLPDFNPHATGAAKNNQRFNRLTMGVYELGSVFKIFSTAAFLETHNLPMSTTFDAREPLKAGRFTINDYHAEDRILTVPEVFMYSSNIGSAMMGQAVGPERLKQFYDDLGLLAPMDLEIAEIARPLVPKPWGEVSTMTASYGHGLATTPLQVAAAVATVVNGGYVVSPTLVRSVAQPSSPNQKEIRIISEESSRKVRQLMELTVIEGTGKSAAVPGYRVGGKTGTAEKSVAGGYDRKKLISSFVAAFPVDDPQYIVLVAVDEPKGNKESYGYATGGWVAAPAVARIIKSMAAVLNIPARHRPDHYVSPLKQYVAVKG